MNLYRGRHITVEAMPWFPFSVDSEAYRGIICWLSNHETCFAIEQSFTGDDRLVISYPERFMTAEPGDWVVRDSDGGFWKWPPEYFEVTYKKIEIE